MTGVQANMVRVDLVTVPEWVVLSAVRYATFRESYVVADTIGMVKDVWPSLSPATRRLLAADVERELSMFRGLPSMEPWEELREWLEAQE